MEHVNKTFWSAIYRPELNTAILLRRSELMQLVNQSTMCFDTINTQTHSFWMINDEWKINKSHIPNAYTQRCGFNLRADFGRLCNFVWYSNISNRLILSEWMTKNDSDISLFPSTAELKQAFYSVFIVTTDWWNRKIA